MKMARRLSLCHFLALNRNKSVILARRIKLWPPFFSLLKIQEITQSKVTSPLIYNHESTHMQDLEFAERRG